MTTLALDDQDCWSERSTTYIAVIFPYREPEQVYRQCRHDVPLMTQTLVSTSDLA
jgi:hypothetical protein